MERMIALKELSEMTGVEESLATAVFNLNICSFVENKDYMKKNSSIEVSIPACILLLPSLTRDMSKIESIINELTKSPEQVYLEERLEIFESKMIERMDSLYKSVKNSYSMLLDEKLAVKEKLDRVKPTAIAPVKKETVVSMIPHYEPPQNLGRTNRKNIITNAKGSRKYPYASEDTINWMEKMEKSIIDTAHLRTGYGFSHIVNHVYKIMRDKYGFVSDQEKKNVRDRYNLDSCNASTFFCIADDKQWRSIFTALLEDYTNEIKDEIAGTKSKIKKIRPEVSYQEELRIHEKDIEEIKESLEILHSCSKNKNKKFITFCLNFYTEMSSQFGFKWEDDIKEIREKFQVKAMMPCARMYICATKRKSEFEATYSRLCREWDAA